MKFQLILFLILISLAPTSGQKFRFATSLGTSYINWSQNQVSLTTSAALQFQKPGKPTQLFGQLSIIGNMQSSRIGDNSVTFRGGKGEIGMSRFTKSGLFASASIYSLSMAKKTRTSNKDFLSDEKFSLHGLRAGLGFKSNSKVKTTAQVKVFKPFLAKVSLENWSNEQNTTLTNPIGYQALIEFRLPNWALGIDYEHIEYGQPYTSLQTTSAQITYFF